MIKIRIKDCNAMLAKATDSDEIARLQSQLKQWKQHLHDAEMLEFEDRVGFKSMERNAGVWGER
jgi:hypothetical protein|tara:strand:+ start:232 stop:423 length:192 start_codon:yes stop_codon:yes gene_type:complete